MQKKKEFDPVVALGPVIWFFALLLVLAYLCGCHGGARNSSKSIRCNWRNENYDFSKLPPDTTYFTADSCLVLEYRTKFITLKRMED